MKWQKARILDDPEASPIWVLTGRPKRHYSHPYDADTGCYENKRQRIPVYRTNVVEPMGRGIICIEAQAVELLPEFAETADPDYRFMRGKSEPSL